MSEIHRYGKRIPRLDPFSDRALEYGATKDPFGSLAQELEKVHAKLMVEGE